MINATGDGKLPNLEARTDALACVHSIIDTVREPLLILDGHLRVQSANRSFYRTFRVSAQDTEGHLLCDLGDRQWNIPHLQTLLEEILVRHTSFDDFEIEHDFPAIGRKVLLLNASRLQQEGVDGILLAIEDVTERRQADSLGNGTNVEHGVDISARRQIEEALRESEARFRTMADGLPLMVWVHDAEGRQEFVNRTFCEFFGVSAEEVAGDGWQMLMHPEDAGRYTNEFLVCMRARAPFHAEVRVRAADGQWHWLESWGRPRFGRSGAFLGFVGTSADVTERKAAEAALQDADRRKDAFLATLAHELRNPLAPIRTGLELIEALRGDAAACEEPIRIMDRQISHLVRLVDDLLDVSRISRGKIQLRKERLELREVIDAALQMSGSGLSRDDRQLSVSVPSEPLAVEGDRVRLVQIVANLLNNAAKFTDKGGHISLRVVRQGDRVEIQVQDDGRGIPHERLDQIFEMFSQCKPDPAGGLGIGLSLVRGLVEMHGGTVSAESGGLGCGATFTVSLPLCHSAPAQPTAEISTELGSLPTQCRVLVADDNRDIAEGLRLLLTTLGAEVRVAHDGAEAVRIFEDWPPTHILMDLGMPGMDGYEAARRLRAKHPDRAFRLIAVTGWGQEEDRQRTREAGFDEHLVKPVRVHELKTILFSSIPE
jgi:PAS domain S-box-containing protein